MENENTTEINPNAEVQIDQERLSLYLAQMKNEQNLGRGITAAAAASIASAILWALITVVTNYQIGYMAVAVGFLVGWTNARYGKGVDKVFGYAGAALALLGCLLGNFFSVVAIIGNEVDLTYWEAFSRFGVSGIISIMGETASPIDLLFYGLALYEGYKFSFRKISEEEMAQFAVNPATEQQ